MLVDFEAEGLLDDLSDARERARMSGSSWNFDGDPRLTVRR